MIGKLIESLLRGELHFSNYLHVNQSERMKITFH